MAHLACYEFTQLPIEIIDILENDISETKDLSAIDINKKTVLLNQLNEWVEKIESIYYDSNKLKKISESGKSTIMKEYKIENFTNNLEKLISK